MKSFRVSVHIVPRKGLLDPQGKAVADALHSLGFHAVDEEHVGRHLVIDVKAADAKAAEASVRKMCTRLLANPVTEDFEVEAVRAAVAA